MNMRLSAVIALCWALPWMVFAQAKPGAALQGSAPEPGLQAAAPAESPLSPVAEKAGGRKLAAGDLIFVNVHRQPDLSSTTQVDESGNVAIKYAGNVTVAGLSEGEASARISAALRTILKNPKVTVSRNMAATGGAGFSEARGEEMDTRIVPLNNSNAEVVCNALNGMSTAGGSVSFDPDTNSIILTDSPNTVQKMLGVIMELDQMQSQVMQVHIEAKIAEVSSTAAKEIGVRWFAQGDKIGGGYTPNPRQDTRVNTARGVSDPLYNEKVSTGDWRGNGGGRRFIDETNWDRRLQVPLQLAAPGQVFLGYMNSGIDFGSMIDALVSDNKAHVLAEPYIRTVNHKMAEIKMTEQYPFSETGSVGMGTVSNTRFLDVGIILKVTPHVRKSVDGQTYIQMELQPEVSTASAISNGVPIRSVRTSNSVANVLDRQTLVIGGIVQNDERDVVQKVPGLGDIPMLGNLFKHKEKSRNTNELMIFVTPTIYDQPGAAVWTRSMDMGEMLKGRDAKNPYALSQETRKE